MYTFITKHTMHQLYFVPRVLINRDSTKRVIQASTEVKLQLMIDVLEDMIIDHDSTVEQRDYLHEAIGSLHHVASCFGDPGDSFGEPSITLDEMHTAAWQQHKEMHS
jgi:hypothetical protein